MQYLFQCFHDIFPALFSMYNMHFVTHVKSKNLIKISGIFNENFLTTYFITVNHILHKTLKSLEKPSLTNMLMQLITYNIIKSIRAAGAWKSADE